MGLMAVAATWLSAGDAAVIANSQSMLVTGCLLAEDAAACASVQAHLQAALTTPKKTQVRRAVRFLSALGSPIVARRDEISAAVDDDPWALYWLGYSVYRNTRQIDDMIALWRTASVPSQRALQLAAQAHVAGDAEQVSELVSAATRLHPARNDTLEPYRDIRQMANSLEEWGYRALSADVQALIASHEPATSIYHWYAVAEIARLNDDYERTIEALTTARRTWPDDDLLRLRLIQAYLGVGSPATAIPIAEDWLSAEPASPVALFWGAEAAYRAGDWVRSRLWCEQLLASGIEDVRRDVCLRRLPELP